MRGPMEPELWKGKIIKIEETMLMQISSHRRNYSQPYFFKINQSSDTGSHGFGAKFPF